MVGPAPDGLIEDAGIIGPRADPALLALLRYAMPALGAAALLLALLLAAALAADAVRRRHGEIEVLRMLGADDPFVLRELRPYPFHPLWLGGLAGAGLGTLVMLMLAEAGPAGSWPVQAVLAVQPLDVAILVLGALAIVLAVALAARQTASAALHRLRLGAAGDRLRRARCSSPRCPAFARTRPAACVRAGFAGPSS